MSSHPDADAFMRSYLRTPTDGTARLVFADWLEETGKPWNVAWAYYIRVKDEVDRYEFGSPERAELEDQAAAYVPRIRARLTIPASLFVGYPKSLLQLLPPSNITVRLGSFRTPVPLREWVHEAVARNCTLFPLARPEGVLLVATAEPLPAVLAERIEYVYRARIVAVRAGYDDIRAAHERNYWPLDEAGGPANPPPASPVPCSAAPATGV
jgi:type IV pilus assembly protein PilB